MSSQELLLRALGLALQKHAGQIDKQGKPYIVHIVRVVGSNRLTSDFERACAALHDIIEDTDVTLDSLRNMGYKEDLIAVVAGVTRIPNESYDFYIDRIIGPASTHAIRLARIRIKLADLDHNLDKDRVDMLSDSDYLRLIPRYMKARTRLELFLAALTDGDRS